MAARYFTADMLFRGTVGGTRGPGGSDLSELRRSIERPLALPPQTARPEHRIRKPIQPFAVPHRPAGTGRCGGVQARLATASISTAQEGSASSQTTAVIEG